MSRSARRLRRLLPSVLVLVVSAALFLVARLPSASERTRAELAAGFRFTSLPIALPANLPMRTVRDVNPRYARIRAWISSVGAGIAVNDLAGTGVAADLCLVDSRSDAVVVTPAPTGAGRYQPFVLDPAPLPVNTTMAPMGCAPGDFNSDGRMDLLVYFWGRTPVLFLRRPAATAMDAAAYLPTELVAQQVAADGSYRGEPWNTNSVTVADFDGDGHPDVGVFNYFPDSDVLDPAGQPNVQMNDSMSGAQNAGGAHLLRWTGSDSGDGRAPATPRFVEQRDAIPYADATGWTLAAGSADLDGDLLPELYVANDFGHDHLFHNRSTPGRLRFETVTGKRTATTPKSMVLGHDSFKSMAIDFGDLDRDGMFDMFVSNISTAWGLEESNFMWMNTARDNGDAKARLSDGTAPFVNRAAELNMAWSGWGWDAKMADLDNSGELSVVQTNGFVKGDVNRWPWLQELAMTNDLMLANPLMWPKAGVGDDIAGDQRLAFWVREPNGRYVDLSPQLGLDTPTPTRGVAIADTTGVGAQDFAVARQWQAPVFYHNELPSRGAYLGLRLYRPVAGDPSVRGTPAYGAVVRIVDADGRTRVAQLDGGSGHSGKRSFDVHFGLGSASSAPVAATVTWRDLDGAVHEQRLTLTPGWHDLMLATQAQEVTAR